MNKKDRKIKGLIRRNDKLESENYELKKDNECLRLQIEELIGCDLEKENKRIKQYELVLSKELEQIEKLKHLYQQLINKQSDLLKKNKKVFTEQTNKAIKEFNSSLLNR